MTWTTRVRRWLRRALEKTFVENPAEWLVQMFGGRASATGVAVTPTTAMQCAAVYACVRVISEGVASLPLEVYRRLDGGGRVPAPEHPLYPLLHDSPNPEQTAFEFRELLQGHLALRGNAYAEQVLTGAGRVTALWPLHPDRVRVERTTGRLVYHVRLPDDAPPMADGSREARLGAERVLHLRGLSNDGVMGLSPIQVARETLGLTLAVEEYGARFFGQGAVPVGVIEHPARLGDKAIKNLRESWEALHGGLQQAHRLAILEEGMKYQALGLQNEHAQFLQTRKFQVSEIARIFRVPPHKIADLERATFSNIEHQAIEFVTDTLVPWLERWEQRLMLSLLTPAERRTFFIEHVVAGLLRGDLKSRYDAYAIGRNWGWLSINDVRRLENLNPLPAAQGDVYLVPLNMRPADQPPTADPDPPGADEGQRRLTRLMAVQIPRVVRRELEAVRTAATRRAGDVAAWRAWVDEFYQQHTLYLAEALAIELDAARAYARDHRAALLAEGLAVLDEWAASAAQELAALARAEEVTV